MLFGLTTLFLQPANAIQRIALDNADPLFTI